MPPFLDVFFPSRSVLKRSYTCRCGRPVFFRNSQCLGCGAQLGYEPNLAVLAALDPGPEPGLFTLTDANAAPAYHRCANLVSPSGCNWLVPSGEGALCKCCRLDRVIPNLAIDADGYRQVSLAKRRLVSQLLALGLPVESRVTEDPVHGLAFDFLRSFPDGPQVMTGHEEGVICLNIQETEDPTRERIRSEMGEPYRTVLGHLRHEVGHYYWDRLVRYTGWLGECRNLFGDETQDYSTALQTYYQNGAPPDWPQRFVTAYASAHPWEDWAETWAHYLLMVDTFETAWGFGIDAESIAIDVEPFPPDALPQPHDGNAERFLQFVHAWTRLSAVLNELSRGMGLNDFYPFVLSRSAVAKLYFVHRVVLGPAPPLG